MRKRTITLPAPLCPGPEEGPPYADASRPADAPRSREPDKERRKLGLKYG